MSLVSKTDSGMPKLKKIKQIQIINKLEMYWIHWYWVFSSYTDLPKPNFLSEGCLHSTKSGRSNFSSWSLNRHCCQIHTILCSPILTPVLTSRTELTQPNQPLQCLMKECHVHLEVFSCFFVENYITYTDLYCN